MSKKNTVSGISSLLIVLMAGPVSGATKSDEALARAQYIIRQLNAEKATLGQESLDLKRQLEVIEKSLINTKLKLKKSITVNKKYKQSVKHSKQSHTDTKQILADVRRDLRMAKLNNTQLTNTLQLYNSDLNQCITNNNEIYQLTTELIKEGLWEPSRKTESFFQLKRVQMENLAQDYQYNAEDLIFKTSVDSQDPAS